MSQLRSRCPPQQASYWESIRLVDDDAMEPLTAQVGAFIGAPFGWRAILSLHYYYYYCSALSRYHCSAQVVSPASRTVHPPTSHQMSNSTRVLPAFRPVW